MALDSTIEIGERIGPDGKYEIIKPLGEGGMGAVFKAFDRFLERDVAIKTILIRKNQTGTDTASRNLRERFLREARAVARVQHPNIIQIFEIGVDRERPFMAMELVDGDDLSKLKHKLTLEEICFAGDGVASALDYMHAKGLYHRDVKPQNVMMSRNRQVKLMDFGIAKDTQKESLTQHGVNLGTPLYMAPEVLGNHPVSSKSDQYALTVILYELLTMQYPFTGSNLLLLLGAIRSQPPRCAASVSPWVPLATEAVLTRGLSKDPDARFKSCSDLTAEFRRSFGEINKVQAVIDRRRQDAESIWSQSQQSLPELRRLADDFQDWPYRDDALERIQQLEADEQSREAWERIALEAFEDAKRRRSTGQLRGFLQRYHDSRHSQAARDLLAKIEREANEEAERQREKLAAAEKAFETARLARDADALQLFVLNFAESPRVPYALALIGEIHTEIERKRKEQEDREQTARRSFHVAAIERDPVALREWLRQYSDLAALAPQVEQELKRVEAENAARLEQEQRRKSAEEAQIQKAFDSAARADDVSALRSFVAFYPDSPLANNARLLIQKLEDLENARRIQAVDRAYQVAATSGDPALLRKFLREHPEAERANDANARLAELERRLDEKARAEAAAQADFERAIKQKDRQWLAEFVRKNSTDFRAQQAKSMLAELDAEDARIKALQAKQAEQFELARRSRDPEALRTFLREAAGSPQRAEANRLLHEIEEWIKRGDRLLDQAKSAGSISTAQEFLNSYASHPREQEAKGLIEELQARLRQEERRKQQEEQAAWSSIQVVRDPRKVSQFIATFPSGPFTVQARALVEVLRKEVQETLESGDPDRIRRFHLDNPQMVSSSVVEQRLKQLEQDAWNLEQDAWNRLDLRDAAQLDYFLQRYPSGIHALTAHSALLQVRQEDNDYQVAIRPNNGSPNAEALRKFQETYPESRHASRVATQLEISTRQTATLAESLAPAFAAAEESTLAAGSALAEPPELPPAEEPPASPPPPPPPELPREKKYLPRKVARWILAGTAAVILVVFGIKLWLRKPSPPGVTYPVTATAPPAPSPDTSDTDTWLAASIQQSPEASRNYLAHFPNGKHRVEAAARIKLLENGAADAFESAKKSGDPGQLEAFARTYPWSNLQPSATKLASDWRREEDTAFREVSSAPTGEKIKLFQQRYPWSNRVSDLRSKQGEEDYWVGLAASQSPKDFDDFAKKYAHSVHAPDARAKSTQLRADESRAWIKVSSTDNMAEMQQFKKTFPWSDRIPQIDLAIERTREDERYWSSVNQSDPRSLRRFIESHPGSPHTKDAHQKESELTDRANRAFDSIKKDDIAALERFVIDFNWSVHTAEANQRIEAIRFEKAAAQRIEKGKEKEDKTTPTEVAGVNPTTTAEMVKHNNGDLRGKDGLTYKVVLGKNFRMSETETTIGAFDLYLKMTAGAAKNPKNSNFPVTGITYPEAEGYCTWVGGRLPRNDEWDYAAHGGKQFAYPNGDQISRSEARFKAQYASEVKAYPPNGYGLYDMAGNVAEMVQGPFLKGGNYLSSAPDLRISLRYSPREAKSDKNGFRCVIPLP